MLRGHNQIKKKQEIIAKNIAMAINFFLVIFIISDKSNYMQYPSKNILHIQSLAY